MRLKPDQTHHIIQACEVVFKKHNIPLVRSALYLYGSRIKDALKGGDIDLLLRVPMEILSSSKKLRIPFSLEIQKRLGEQRIDVLIIDRASPQDPFHQIAVEQAVLLKQW